MARAVTIDRKPNEHLEMFGLVWLDSNLHENRHIEQKLRSIIHQLMRFPNVHQCQDFLGKIPINDRFILIASESLGKEIVPKINSIRQMISIYIYGLEKKKATEHWSSKYSKVKRVVGNLEELISIIADDHQIEKKLEEPLAINISSIGGNSTSKLDGKFVFQQVLIDCLLRLKSIDQDRRELIQLLKQEYQENATELNSIEDFNKTYKSNRVLSWYTKECFFYRTLNSALRKEMIHWIFLYRSFICDLQQQLQKYQSRQILTVYRAQVISKEEFENLKLSINRFISINSFFSTTLSYQKALSFLAYTQSNDKTERILFQIQANPNIEKSEPFANISRFSDHSDEEEVLFMIGAIFQLKEISFQQKNQYWLIKMTLSSDNENELKQVLTHVHRQTGHGPTNLRILAKVLSRMGQLELAEKYLKRMIEQMSSNDSQLGILYEDLANVMSQMGKLDESAKWHNKSIAINGNNTIARSSALPDSKFVRNLKSPNKQFLLFMIFFLIIISFIVVVIIIILFGFIVIIIIIIDFVLVKCTSNTIRVIVNENTYSISMNNFSIPY